MIKSKIPLNSTIILAILITFFIPIYIIDSDSTSLSLRIVLPLLVFPIFTKALFNKKNHNFLIFLSALIVLCFSIYNEGFQIQSLKSSVLLLYFLALLLAFEEYEKTKNSHKLYRFFLIAATIIPISIACFKLIPSLETKYYSSSIINFVFPRTDIYKIYDGTINSLDENKVGGLFYLNGNWASTTCFVVLCLVNFIFKDSLNKIILSIIFLLGILFSGSKTGYFLLAFIIFLFLFLFLLKNLKNNQSFYLISLLFILIIYLSLVDDKITSTLAINFETFYSRSLLWERAINHIPDYIYIGKGESYWYNLYITEGKILWYDSLPPHNYLLQLLMVSGFIPILFLVYFISISFKKAIVLFKYTRQSKYIWLIASMIWVIAHSLLENITFFGETSIMIIMAIIYTKINLDHFNKIKTKNIYS